MQTQMHDSFLPIIFLKIQQGSYFEFDRGKTRHEVKKPIKEVKEMT